MIAKSPMRFCNRRDTGHTETKTMGGVVRREVEKLIEAAKGYRWGHRDATMILIAYDLRSGSGAPHQRQSGRQKKKRQPRYSPSNRPRITRSEAA